MKFDSNKKGAEAESFFGEIHKIALFPSLFVDRKRLISGDNWESVVVLYEPYVRLEVSELSTESPILDL